MLIDRKEPSLQIKAYLKRMASCYDMAPEPEPSEEIEALLAALGAPPADGADPRS